MQDNNKCESEESELKISIGHSIEPGGSSTSASSKKRKRKMEPFGLDGDQTSASLTKRRRLSSDTCEKGQKKREVLDVATLKSTLSERLVWEFKGGKVPKDIFSRAAKRDVEHIDLNHCNLEGVKVPDPFPDSIK